MTRRIMYAYDKQLTRPLYEDDSTAAYYCTIDLIDVMKPIGFPPMSI